MNVAIASKFDSGFLLSLPNLSFFRLDFCQCLAQWKNDRRDMGEKEPHGGFECLAADDPKPRRQISRVLVLKELFSSSTFFWFLFHWCALRNFVPRLPRVHFLVPSGSHHKWNEEFGQEIARPSASAPLGALARPGASAEALGSGLNPFGRGMQPGPGS